MSVTRPGVPKVLVVRSEALCDRVAAALEAAGVSAVVEQSPSYLSAMGWLTQQRADVVIGPVSAMTGMVGSTARALRKLVPGVRLIAVAEEHEQAEAQVVESAGFDRCVVEPVHAGGLVSAIGLVGERSNQQEHVPAAGVSAADHAATVEAAQQRGFGREEGVVGLPGMDWLGLETERTEVDIAGGIGDVDLIEAVMRRDGSLMPLATRLLREQSGLIDATFSELGQGKGEARLAVDVSYAGTNFGSLTASDGDVQALGAWAAWLARWIAIERRQNELYTMAMRDRLTGIWNRRYFELFLERVLRHAAQGRQQVTLMLFDIDDFKQYNDNYSHAAGDEILKAAASLIQSVVRDHDVVARIGGDEFAVIFWDKGEPRHQGSQHPDDVIGIAKRFQKAIVEHKFPQLGQAAIGRLTVSGGLAGFPWDGRTPAELLARADAMAMRSKQQGKNAICFGPGAAPNGNGKH